MASGETLKLSSGGFVKDPAILLSWISAEIFVRTLPG